MANATRGFNTRNAIISVLGRWRGAALLDFLVQGLGGHGNRTSRGRLERIANAQVRLGTSTVMVSEGSPPFLVVPVSLHRLMGGTISAYVESADAAMASGDGLRGATKVMEVADMPYNDRQGRLRYVRVRDLWRISEP